MNQHQQSPDKQTEIEEDDNPIVMPEVKLPGTVYKHLVTMYPPNPLLPKSFAAKDDSPRSGGMFKFLKLSKFRGVDQGRSKFRMQAE